jgi:hypothetical protein
MLRREEGGMSGQRKERTQEREERERREGEVPECKREER